MRSSQHNRASTASNLDEVRGMAVPMRITRCITFLPVNDTGATIAAGGMRPDAVTTAGQRLGALRSRISGIAGAAVRGRPQPVRKAGGHGNGERCIYWMQLPDTKKSEPHALSHCAGIAVHKQQIPRYRDSIAAAVILREDLFSPRHIPQSAGPWQSHRGSPGRRWWRASCTPCCRRSTAWCRAGSFRTWSSEAD